MYGTVRASGSTARIAAFIASTRSPSNVVSYGGSSVIHVFDGLTGTPLLGMLGGFQAYAAGQTDGVFVAAGKDRLRAGVRGHR